MSIELKDINDASRLRVKKAEGNSPISATELFRFSFGSKNTSFPNPKVVDVPLPLLNSLSPVCEAWDCGEITESGNIGNVQFSKSDSWLMLHQTFKSDEATPVEKLTENAYKEMLKFAYDSGYLEVLRTWNFIPNINSGVGDSEQYRLFSLGRAAAFDTCGISMNELPAGTAIGITRDHGLSITFLCSRRRVERIENPRQISAYRYPRQYGLKSPLFSRAVLAHHNNPKLLFVSGTASIIGHESIHTGNAEQQLVETMVNLEHIEELAERHSDFHKDPGNTVYKIYIRKGHEQSLISSEIVQALCSAFDVIILEGDICRSDLLTEIECICQF